MKKQLVYILVGAGLLASPAYADRYNRFQPPGSMDQSTSSSEASANEACRQARPDVFYGAVNSSSQMGEATNTTHLLSSGNVLPYFNISGIAATVYGAGGDISDVSGPIGISGFKNILKVTGIHGIIELSNSKFMTPHVSSKYWQNVLTANGSEPIDEKTLLQQVGFKPTIATFNVRRSVKGGVDHNNNEYFTENDIVNFQTAAKDIMANVPSVKQVWPFIIGDSTHDFATDHYWANARTVIRQAGGVALDMPAGLYYLNGIKSVQPIIKQIKWANSQGLNTLVLLSPYSLETPPGYGPIVYPQWRYDDKFLAHVQILISWLKAADALPTSWAVVNYSPIQWYNPSNKSLHGNACSRCIKVTANYMGSDNDSANQTVAYVARWVAENAPTSHNTSMPDMGSQFRHARLKFCQGIKNKTRH